MRKKRRNVDRIAVQKMLKWCNILEELMTEYNSSFELYQNKMSFQLSCSACIIQIGELTTQLTEEFKAQHAEIPWLSIKGMRNLHAHEYEEVNLKIMWKTLTQEIPTLKEQLEKILAAESDATDDGGIA